MQYKNKWLFAEKLQFQLKLYPWISTNQKKLLIKYTKSCQVSFFVLSLIQNSTHIFSLIELFLHNLWCQLYAIEFGRWKVENCIKNKIKWLGELKYFTNKKAFLLKRIFAPSGVKKKRGRSVYFVVDLLIQQLFTLVLNPRVKAKIELDVYSFKKNTIFIKGMNEIKNNVYYKLTLTNEIFGYAFLNMRFDLINYTSWSKNIFLPLKYEFIFRGWLRVMLVEFLSVQRCKSNFKASVIGILSFLLTNLIFIDTYRLIYFTMLQFKIIASENFFTKFSSTALKLSSQSKLSNDIFEDRHICWDFFWDIKSFVLLSNSKDFLSTMTKKVQHFLLMRGLRIQINVSIILWVKANADFYFLESIFSCGIKTKFVRKRLLRTKNKVWKRRSQSKSLIYLVSKYINIFKFFLNAYSAVVLNASVYKIILMLNGLLIKWIDRFLLKFQKVWDFLQFWLYKWFCFWTKRKYFKNVKIFLNKYCSIVKYYSFRNHIETLYYLKKIKCMFLKEKFFWGVLGVMKGSFESFYFVVPKINVILGLRKFITEFNLQK